MISALAAMSSAEDETVDHERVDAVFAEAVRRGIILRSDTLDSCSEFDLSGMSLPVARAAVRFILHRIATSASKNDDEETKGLTLITGVGVGKGGEGTGSTSLREYVREILKRDFEPELPSSVPRFAQGTVEIEPDSIAKWIQLRDQ